MLCTFTTETGDLIVRSDDIRAIEDRSDGTFVAWSIGGENIKVARIVGTALENAARIQQDELDMFGRIEEHRQQLQRRIAEGYPAVPVQRGKQR